MKKLCWAICGVALAFTVACSAKAGQSCKVASDCGSKMACDGCGSGVDGGTPYCAVTCTTNADCTGTSDVFGPTPHCDMDSCGAHICGI